MASTKLFLLRVVKLTERNKTWNQNYKELMAKTKALFVLQSTESIVNWDMETKMPPKAITLRSEQLALLGELTHTMQTDPKIGVLLENLERHPTLQSRDALQRRNLYLIRKSYDEQIRLPQKLVVDTAKQQAITVDTWKKAKAVKDFALFQPELEKLMVLKKQAAAILRGVKQTATPYDAFIDIYEPKMTADVLSSIFETLKTGLIELLTECQGAKKQPNLALLRRRVPIRLQQRLSEELAQFLGYDTTSAAAGGRIDETEHPFTTGYYDGVRITTHYYETKITSSLFSVLHEGGHAIYDQNLKPEWMYQPVGESCSMGFHESQSRLVENIIGRSHEFWDNFFPKFQHLTGDAFSGVDPASFVFAINHVKPTTIRVEADEVTYNLHIILRFEIERALMAEKLTVREIPALWNQKYRDYLGVEISDDSEGIMQDTHWASGLIGYFPSYALGNIYSGQILRKMEHELPEWKTQITQGDFQPIKQWLTANIYQYGNLYDPPELIQKVTGHSLTIEPYLTYLKEKFRALYEV